MMTHRHNCDSGSRLTGIVHGNRMVPPVDRRGCTCNTASQRTRLTRLASGLIIDTKSPKVSKVRTDTCTNGNMTIVPPLMSTSK